MTKRLITLLAALLVLGFAVAGCGDDESDGGGSGGTTAAETVPEASTDAATSDETATDDVTRDKTATDDVSETEADTDIAEEETQTEQNDGAAAPLSHAQKLENCETSLDDVKKLPADRKETLIAACKKAASGDPEAVREAGRALCEWLRSASAPKELPPCKDGGP